MENVQVTSENKTSSAPVSKLNMGVLFRDAGIGLALLVLIIFFSLTTEHFLSPNNISNILTQITINLILAIGMTFVILIGALTCQSDQCWHSARLSREQS